MAEGQPHVLPSSVHYLPHQVVWRILSSGISSPVIEPIVTAPPLAGKLTLVILRAKRLYNVSTFGHMDPFVEVKVGDVRAKTKVCKRGHVNPDFSVGGGEKLEFLLNGQETLLRIRVFHKTTFGETVVGTARVPIDFLLLHHGRSATGVQLPAPLNCANPSLNTCWLEIGRENKQSVEAGSVLISVHFEMSNGQPLLASTSLPPMEQGRSEHFYIIPDQVASSLNNQNTNGSTTGGGNTTAAINIASLTAGASPASNSLSPFRLKEKARSLSTSIPSNALTPQSGSHSHNSSGSFNAPGSSSSSVAGGGMNARGSVIVQSSQSMSRPQLFGGTLSNGMMRSKSSVPVVVFVCISYLFHHGLKCEGLFRISSQSEAQDALRKAFEAGSSIEVSDPHVTGDVLKSYFRQLLDPLIPSAFYQQFLNATDLRHPETSVPLLKKLLEQLPPDNYNVLSYLLHFLTVVAKHSDVNKMNIKNCALVFSPNILRKSTAELNASASSSSSNPAEQALNMAKEMQRSEDCIHLLLLHYNDFFPSGPPTPFALHHPSKDRPSIAPLRHGASQRKPGEAVAGFQNTQSAATASAAAASSSPSRK